MISFACPYCQKPLRVKDEVAGKRSKCPGCGQAISTPALPANPVGLPAVEEAKDGKEQKPWGTLAKVLAAVFGAVVAPILVALGVKWGDPSLWKSAPATQLAPAPETPPTGSPSTGLISPTEVTHLLSPRLSDHFDFYHWSKNNDMVRNDASGRALFPYDTASGTIRAPGHLGGLITNRDYSNYLLTVEYRWGNKTYPGRAARSRLAHVSVHMASNDGTFSNRSRSHFEVALGEGICGNLFLKGTTDQLKAMGKVRERKVETAAQWVYDPGAPAILLASGGKMPPDFNGWAHHLGAAEKFEDVKGVHPPGDPSVPGEWNKVEVACQGNTITVHVNGKEVNALTGLNRAAGRIAVETHQAEVAFRRIDIGPLQKP